MNYFDAVRRLLTREDREKIREKLVERGLFYTDKTIHNVINGGKRYSPEILKVVHEEALRVLTDAQNAINSKQD